MKVGGPAIGNPGDFAGEIFHPAPFTAKFLDYCREHQVPLDFFSWHRYTANPWDLRRRAQGVRRLLDERGFSGTESHCNEWNFLPRDDWSPLSAAGTGAKREQWFAEMGGARGAAFAASTLLLWQDSPVDVANFYTGEIQGFGLFDFNGVPRKNFYAFRAFRELLKTPVRIVTPTSKPGQFTIGAGLSSDNRIATILVSNFNSPENQLVIVLANLPWKEAAKFEVLRIDDQHNLVPSQSSAIASNTKLTLTDFAAPAVALIKLIPASQ